METGGQRASPKAMIIAPRITRISPLTTSPAVYEKFELRADVEAGCENPYDPDSIRVDATFASPSGKRVTIPAFYYHPFTDVSETRTGDPAWRVRFTPWETGRWQYYLSVSAGGGTATSEPQAFEAVPSDQHGFIRVDSRNPAYFAFDDGTPYFPVGLNMAWSVGNVLDDYRAWLDALARSGGNAIRLWMASWGFGIEWNDTGLGNYEQRQRRAYLLDRVLEMCAERGIYVIFSLLNHGTFSSRVDAEWQHNPYNRAKGGMLSAPAEFLTHPDAIRLWHQRLRYVVARWGYSPHILAWEWWNEIHHTPLHRHPALRQWLEDSATVLRALDPYRHLITNSGPGVGAAAWQLDSMDVVQDHRYHVRDVPDDFRRTVTRWRRRHPGRPFLISEFGDPDKLDASGAHLHLGLWSAAMNGAAGAGMIWWWDTYVHPQNQYAHLAGIAAFFRNEDMGAHAWQPTTTQLQAIDGGKNAVRVYGLQSPSRALLWLVRSAYARPARRAHPLANVQVRLRVNALADGDYRVEFRDTFHGEIVGTTNAQAQHGQITFDSPPFTRDLADMAVKIMHTPAKSPLLRSEMR